MSIKYGDSGMLVTYIQMFLKEYYSKFIKIESNYSRDVQENLLNYINSPDSITMNEMIYKALNPNNSNSSKDVDLGGLFKYFKRTDGIDEIYFESKISHKEENNKFPTIDNEAVSWINDNLIKFEEFILKQGWKIKDYNYNNENFKCDITISKLNKNILPKSSLIDLVNMYDRKYNEICYASHEDSIYFSSLYNFEIRNYEKELNSSESYNLFVPTINNKCNIIRDKKSGNYYTEDNKLFKGLSTFTINVYPDNTEQYYVIYIKKPRNSEILNECYAYINYSKNIGKKVSIDYSGSESLEKLENKYEVVMLDNSLSYNSEYFIITVKIPKNLTEDYKLCLSLYDPNNELDTIFAFKLDENYINNSELDSSVELLTYQELINNLSKVILVDPASYYSSPFIIHDKFLSYILEAIVHEYSREEDIILIQKLANKVGFSYDSTEIGEYTESLKEFITNIQNFNLKKDGSLIMYGKGYVDPDTESILKIKSKDF